MRNREPNRSKGTRGLEKQEANRSKGTRGFEKQEANASNGSKAQTPKGLDDLRNREQTARKGLQRI